MTHPYCPREWCSVALCVCVCAPRLTQDVYWTWREEIRPPAASCSAVLPSAAFWLLVMTSCNPVSNRNNPPPPGCVCLAQLSQDGPPASSFSRCNWDEKKKKKETLLIQTNKPEEKHSTHIKSQSSPSLSTSLIRFFRRRLKKISNRRSSSITREVFRPRSTICQSRPSVKSICTSHRNTYSGTFFVHSSFLPLSRCCNERGSSPALLLSEAGHGRGRCSPAACESPYCGSHSRSWLWEKWRNYSTIN